MDERVIAVEWFMKGAALKGADPFDPAGYPLPLM